MANNKGVTLVEALVTVLLFTLLFGVAVAILLSSSDSWQLNSVQAELIQERRKAVEWMKLDLQQGGYTTITDVPADGNWYNTITFYTATGVSGGNVTWSADTVNFSSSGAPLYQLRKTSGAAVKVIANNIQTLQFRRLAAAPNIVYVSITAQKNTLKGQALTATTSFEVKMRN